MIKNSDFNGLVDTNTYKYRHYDISDFSLYVNGSYSAILLGWYLDCRLKQSCASAGSPDTTPAEPNPNSNTQQSKNNTANVVVQQHSRKLLKMDIIMPETC